MNLLPRAVQSSPSLPAGEAWSRKCSRLLRALECRGLAGWLAMMIMMMIMMIRTTTTMMIMTTIMRRRTAEGRVAAGAASPLRCRRALTAAQAEGEGQGGE
eukprot:scaffold6275_cov229-Prasinococcus_capsulatus_cf.AAC.1